MADDAAKKDLREAGREYESKLADALARQSEPKLPPKTSYGMPLKSVYTPEDAGGQDYLRDLLRAGISESTISGPASTRVAVLDAMGADERSAT